MKKTIISSIIIGVSLSLLACLTPILCHAQTWKPNPKYIKTKDSVKTGSTDKKYQCSGTTQKGGRCKRKVNENGNFCYQHQNQKNG